LFAFNSTSRPGLYFCLGSYLMFLYTPPCTKVVIVKSETA